MSEDFRLSIEDAKEFVRKGNGAMVRILANQLAFEMELKERLLEVLRKIVETKPTAPLCLQWAEEEIRHYENKYK